MGHLCAVSGRGGGAGEFRTSRGGAPLGAAASLPGASLPGVPKAEIARFFRPFLWARTHLAGGSDFVGVTFSQLTKNYYTEMCTVPSLFGPWLPVARGGVVLGTGGSNARRSASPVARAQRRLVRAVRASGAVPPGPRVPARPRGISRSSRSPPLPRVTCVHLRLPAGEWRSLRPWRRPRPGSRVLPPASLEPHRPASRAGSALCACPLGSACGVLGTRGARRDRSPAATGQSSGPIGSPRAKAHLARAYTRSACLVRRWCARVARGARQSTSRFLQR